MSRGRGGMGKTAGRCEAAGSRRQRGPKTRLHADARGARRGSPGEDRSQHRGVHAVQHNLAAARGRAEARTSGWLRPEAAATAAPGGRRCSAHWRIAAIAPTIVIPAPLVSDRGAAQAHRGLASRSPVSLRPQGAPQAAHRRLDAGASPSGRAAHTTAWRRAPRVALAEACATKGELRSAAACMAAI